MSIWTSKAIHLSSRGIGLMAGERSGNGEQTSTPYESMSAQMEELPILAEDEDSQSESIENAARADIEDFKRSQRLPAARTIFHQRRGDDDTLNSTRSLYDSDVVYFELHGRRYCKDYYMPNDEEEQSRLQMLNEVYYTAFGNRLTTVPINAPQKILDIGTGTGDWAMAMGDEYPTAEVIGTDIAKIQPTAVPLNVFFEIDDAEEEGGWTWAADEFDFVHFRYMCGAFADWKYIYRETFTHLKPSGWVEVVDFDDHRGVLSFFEENSDVPNWFRAVKAGAEKSGRTRSVKHLEPEVLTEIGFVDVNCKYYDIPMGTWRDDEDGKQIGKLFLVATLIGVEAMCLRILSEHMDWEYAEIRRVCEIVRETTWKTALDPAGAAGMGFRLKVLTGRKPGGPPDEMEDSSSSRTMTITGDGNR